jgi:hypothetical protein
MVYLHPVLFAKDLKMWFTVDCALVNEGKYYLSFWQ